MIFPSRRMRKQHYEPRIRQPFMGRPQINAPSSGNEDNLSRLAEKGAGGLSKTLGNIQQILNLIQTAAPVVEEYGPMVKNLPALYRIMKAVNQSGDEEVKPNNELLEKEEEIDTVKERDIPQRRNQSKESKPLLFI